MKNFKPSFKNYLHAEQKIAQQVLEKPTGEINACIDLWDFLELELIVSIERGYCQFHLFFQQAKISFHIAISQLIKLHTSNSQQSHRLALDYMALCIFFVNRATKFNEIFIQMRSSKSEKTMSEIKKQTYKYLEGNKPNTNNHIKKYKSILSDYGAHPNMASPARNTTLPDINQSEMQNNFFDNISNEITHSSHFLMIAESMIRLCEAIAKQPKNTQIMKIKNGAMKDIELHKQIIADLQRKNRENYYNDSPCK